MSQILHQFDKDKVELVLVYNAIPVSEVSTGPLREECGHAYLPIRDQAMIQVSVKCGRFCSESERRILSTLVRFFWTIPDVLAVAWHRNTTSVRLQSGQYTSTTNIIMYSYLDAMRSSLTELCNDFKHHCAAAEASTSKNPSSRQCLARFLKATMATIRGLRDDTKLGSWIRQSNNINACFFTAASRQMGASRLPDTPWQ